MQPCNNSLNSTCYIGTMKALSCDLVSNAKKHLLFLKDIHSYNNTTFEATSLSLEDVPSVKEIESLRRYQELWLPFVFANSMKTDESPPNHDASLIPPPDIAWLWHCHRLAPQAYTEYCKTTFHGGIVEANPPFNFVRKDALDMKSDQATISSIAQTKDLWKEAYPNESFFLEDIVVEAYSEHYTVSRSIHGYDLIGSARRQTAFLWQVSGKKYTSVTFLQQGVKNYEKFLKLTAKAKDLGIILVPTYQIDLMWHTHILSSVGNYNKDCFNIMNSFMYHDDSLTDREEGGILDISYSATQKLWKSVYKAEYVVHGGMYRGEPPSEYYTQAWPDSRVVNVMCHSQNTVNQALIGKVGASSTSSNLVASSTTTPILIPWAPLNGNASDGSPAFIPLDGQQYSKAEIKALPHRDKYILCKIEKNMGYCHIETKEAQEILLERMKDNLQDLEMARNIEICSCGLSSRNRATSAREEYKHANLIFDKLHKQLSVTGASSGNTIPPETLFACAGGACGGIVARKAQNARLMALSNNYTCMGTYGNIFFINIFFNEHHVF